MITVRICDKAEISWRDVPFVRVGEVPSGLPTPDAYVMVAERDEPLLRVDVYDGDHCLFREALMWRGWVVIGFAHHLHLVRPREGDTRSVPLGSYFGHLYPSEDWLLAASGDGLFCVTPNGAVAWSAPDLGIDGVLVDDIESDVVSGRGEWDPPGDWRPFRVSLATGERLADEAGETPSVRRGRVG